jgi:hypothetical protein
MTSSKELLSPNTPIGGRLSEFTITHREGDDICSYFVTVWKAGDIEIEASPNADHFTVQGLTEILKESEEVLRIYNEGKGGMSQEMRIRLSNNGWAIGSVQDLLELTDAEMDLVEAKTLELKGNIPID